MFMYKNLLLSFMLVCSCASMASTEPATKYTVDGLRYALDGNRAIVWPLSDDFSSSYEGDIVVPAKVAINGADYPVAGISRRAFSDCGSLTSVTLPQSIEWMAEGCFANSSELKSISFGDGKTGNGIYEVKDGIVYTVPTDTVFTIDFTKSDHAYSESSSTSNLHFAQYGGHVSLDTDGNEANSAVYFMWNDGTTDHKVLRIYRGYTFTLTSQSGAIKKIEFFFDGRHDITQTEGELSSDGTTWTGHAYSATFESNRRNNLDSVRVTLVSNNAQAFAAPVASAITKVDSVCALAREAFANNMAESITLPATVDFVGYNSLSIRGLKELHVPAAPPKYKENPFVSTDKTSCYLYVPAQYVDDYKADSLWGRFKLIEAEQTTGIGHVARTTTLGGKAYNLGGQAVGERFRGIVIRGGRKVLRR